MMLLHDVGGTRRRRRRIGVVDGASAQVLQVADLEETRLAQLELLHARSQEHVQVVLQ